MEAHSQAVGVALVLAGLGVMLLGMAVLWWAVGRARAEDGELALQREHAERAAQRLRQRAVADQQRIEALRALLPAGAALVGHWLGSRCVEPAQPSRRPCGCSGGGSALLGGLGDLGPPLGAPRLPDPPVSPRPTAEDETQVELDLPSILAAAQEVGLGEWIASVMHTAKVSAESTPHPEPKTASAAG